MENIDVIVLRRLLEWRQAGTRALLVTVSQTWGSSPRPVGSIMALAETGAVVGSVSGGCIEDDLIHRYRQSASNPSPLADQKPQSVRYGISADEAHRFGLPCGGTLELVLEFNPDPALLAELIDALSAGALMRRVLNLQSGEVKLAPASKAESLNTSATELINVFGPQYRMLLIGAGQLTEYLATMAHFSGFAVSVCDPRSEYRGAWSLPEVPILTGWPDDVVREFSADARSCILALTHDPKLDDSALLEALKTDAFYVGAIGSRANNALRHQRLIEHFDQTEASLARLRGPIGIFIGSKTPAEIAVSVMAEVLAVKNGVTLPRDFDVALAKQGLEASHL